MIDYYSGSLIPENDQIFNQTSGHELTDKEYEETKCRMLRPPKDHTSDEETGALFAPRQKITSGF